MTLVCYNPELDRIEEWEDGYYWNVYTEMSQDNPKHYWDDYYEEVFVEGPEQNGRIVLGEL